jgi:hypothetical protein
MLRPATDMSLQNAPQFCGGGIMRVVVFHTFFLLFSLFIAVQSVGTTDRTLFFVILGVGAALDIVNMAIYRHAITKLIIHQDTRSNVVTWRKARSTLGTTALTVVLFLLIYLPGIIFSIFSPTENMAYSSVFFEFIINHAIFIKQSYAAWFMQHDLAIHGYANRGILVGTFCSEVYILYVVLTIIGVFSLGQRMAAEVSTKFAHFKLSHPEARSPYLASASLFGLLAVSSFLLANYNIHINWSNLNSPHNSMLISNLFF